MRLNPRHTQNRSGPVQVFSIQRLGPLADGIHQGDRGTVFVEGALPRERVLARLQHPEKGPRRAELIRVLEPSPDRQPPPCRHYENCGNCTLQHLREQAYRAFKTSRIDQALKQAGIQPEAWRSPYFSGEGQRRRLTFSVHRTSKWHVGYHQRRSPEIIDIESCQVVRPTLFDLRKSIPRLLERVLQPNQFLDVSIQEVGGAVDVLLTGKLGRIQDSILDELKTISQELGIARLSWRLSDKTAALVWFTLRPVVARFGMLSVPLPPGSFLQPSQESENAIVDSILEALPTSRSQTNFADLFSGCGTFSGTLLQRGRVDAFEEFLPAVRALDRAARGLPLQVYRRDLLLNPLSSRELDAYDAVVWDPPRAGCEKQSVQMARSRVRRLIGISCNPATFARDARILCRGGYRLKWVRVIDQFLWSHHVELVSLFER